MIKNRFLALAVAVAMMVGTAVPAFAEGNSGETEVSLTVAPKNTYTLTVPANTELNSDGTAKQLKNGIKIADGTLQEGNKLTVTATSKNDWYMVTTESGVSTKIGYALYSDAGTTAAKTWKFTKDEANTSAGTTKDVYAKADADGLDAADSGTYSDVITFTAKVESATPQVEFTLAIDGVNFQSYSVDKDTTWRTFISEHSISLGSNNIVKDYEYTTMNLDSAIESGRYFVGQAG